MKRMGLLTSCYSSGEARKWDLSKVCERFYHIVKWLSYSSYSSTRTSTFNRVTTGDFPVVSSDGAARSAHQMQRHNDTDHTEHKATLQSKVLATPLLCTTASYAMVEFVSFDWSSFLDTKFGCVGFHVFWRRSWLSISGCGIGGVVDGWELRSNESG